MKLTLIFYLPLVITTSCTPLSSLFHGNNYLDKEGGRQGKWIYYGVNYRDRVESKGRFKDDKPWGRWKYYDTDQNLLRKEKYRRKWGEVIIKTKFYHPNGKVEKEGLAKIEYNDLNTHYYWIGEWNYYFSSGKLSAVKLFSKGLEEPEILVEFEDN